MPKYSDTITLDFDINTDKKVRYKKKFEAVVFNLYIPKNLFDKDFPKRVYVDIAHSRGDLNNSIVIMTRIDQKREKNQRSIPLKSKTHKYHPIKGESMSEAIYIPAELLPDPAPALFCIGVTW